MTTAAPQPKIDIHDIAHRLWETADELRANSHLKAAEYSIPVLGLIFLKFADSRFAQAEAELAGSSTGRRNIGNAKTVPALAMQPCSVETLPKPEP